MRKILALILLFLLTATPPAFAQRADIYGWDGSGSRAIRIDASTESLQTIEYGHHEIHSGSSYTTEYTLTTAASAGDENGVYILTPATKEIHMVAEYASQLAATFTICEGVTLAANTGTGGVAIYNRNRNSANTSQIQDNATSRAANKITTLTEAQLGGDGTWACGTALRVVPVVAGAGPKPAGGSGRGSQEYILKNSTAYVFMLTNTPSTASDQNILLDWYEHTPKN
jgi:hypothetical protein